MHSFSRKNSKKKKPLEIASEQYRRLREELESTPDIQEKNMIYRRMINLLDVMTFLNSQEDGTSH